MQAAAVIGGINCANETKQCNERFTVGRYHNVLSQYDSDRNRFRPGGAARAIQGAKSGKKVALVEKRRGHRWRLYQHRNHSEQDDARSCLHLSGYNYQNIYGVSYRVKEKITMADLAFRVQHVIKTKSTLRRRSFRVTESKFLLG